MHLKRQLFPSERVSFLYIFLICSAALAFVYGAEYLFHIYPCSLCLLQRYFFWAALGIAALGFFLNKRVLLYILSFIFLGCAAIAGYQVLVELKWVSLPKMCQAAGSMSSLDDFKKLLEHGAIVPCDQISWSLFDISMAGYNVIFSLFMSLYSGMSGLYYKRLDLQSWR